MRLALLLLILAAACTNPRELTRDRAAEMIRNSEGFRTPVMLALKKETDWNVRAQSEGESEADARARAVETYYQVYSEMNALRYLGLIDVHLAPRRRPEPGYPTWTFSVEPFLTEKDRAAAAGGQGDQDKPSVRLAEREFVEVTGITKAGGDTTRVEYTWKEAPTEAGLAFVPGSPEYQSLPAPLQQTLAGRNQTKYFGKVRRAAAVFQFYDGGWRLLAAQ
ncbi:MAG TPA: hypothetical protein VF570_03990 [Pyrinomonadaceae bacterium]|jgi:hypothetical protein